VRRLLAILCGALALASCGTTNAVHLIHADQLPPDLYGSHPQAASSLTRQAIVYFVRGNRLVQLQRSGPSFRGGADLVMRLLLDGPSPEDQADGLTTAIPSDTRLLGVSVANRIATVNLSQEFERASTTGSRPQDVYALRLAQVVFSLVELSDVDAVRFEYEGDLQAVPDQNGNPVAGPVSAARYNGFAPIEVPTHVDPCSLVESLGSCSGSAQSH